MEVCTARSLTAQHGASQLCAHGRRFVRWSSPGCYIGGSGAIYYSNTLAASTVAIVITFNYRLGVFGFLGGSDVAAYTPDGSTGNFGIQDQREAMRWVAQNAAAFGGDPARVLIFGESAGAGSVAFHTVSALRRPFRRAS